MLDFLVRVGLVHARARRPSPALFAAGALGGALAAAVAFALAKPLRRAQARDRVKSAAAHTRSLFKKAGVDARNRLVGKAAATKSRLRRDDTSDEKLMARVRTQLGHVVSHPHAIEVQAHQGRVTVSGPILRREVGRLLRTIRSVRGVHGVENRLEPHDRGDAVPALQGAGRARPPELLQEHWTPSLRVSAGLLGVAALIGGGLRIRSPAGIGLGALGAVLVARASLDKPIRQIIGLGAGRRSVDFQKTITIDAPVEEVFAYWASFDHFPEFMDHVQSVSRSDGRSHWKVRGPLGTTIDWDAEITSFVPNQKIAWKSVDGSLIKHAGIVRFEPVDDGRATRLDVRLSYNAIGYLGHGIAALFRVDPKKSLDDDLLRLQSLLEKGKATAHGHEVTRAEIAVAPPVTER
jgi:uncharacterized membrane protein